ncbi:MAG: hypothetical protein ORN98_01020, partial [Alphaproteobacteria bacterium]|nr:hypothetical protein [Alphaproteobacteria bacterium]
THSQTQPHSQPQAAPPKPVRSPRLIDKAIQKMPETAEISKINLRSPKSLDITRGQDGDETSGVSGTISAPLFIIDKITLAIRAKIVAKCGTRQYEDAWIKNIQDITENLVGRLNTLIATKPDAKPAFAAFLTELQSNLNPAVTAPDAIDMLAQHIVTKPVFDSLFADFAFAKHNPVSQAIDKILILLDAHMLLTETKSLAEFYERVKIRTASATSPTAKQKIIISLYDDFFRNALPRQAKRLGIVYTPVEIVDFIIHSVNDVLRQEFGQNLGSPDVRILDPFTGTGTFVTRLLQSGLIPPDQLTAKYQSEIFANEILLLAYYIATINIETAYHDEIKKPRHSPPPLGGRGIHYAAESTILGDSPTRLARITDKAAGNDAGGGPAPAALHASSPAHLHASSPAAVSF